MIRSFAIAFVFAAGLVSAAMAQSPAEQVMTALQDQGYRQFTVTKTLLGRVRIVAEGPNSHREIILNSRTGEILRDYWELVPASPVASTSNGVLNRGDTGPVGPGSGAVASGTSHGGHGSDDDASDDSGHGGHSGDDGGNSGSGSGDGDGGDGDGDGGGSGSGSGGGGDGGDD